MENQENRLLTSFKSYHYGIEISLPKTAKVYKQKSLNRTIMELKLHITKALTNEGIGLNRTIMELK